MSGNNYNGHCLQDGIIQETAGSDIFYCHDKPDDTDKILHSDVK